MGLLLGYGLFVYVLPVDTSHNNNLGITGNVTIDVYNPKGNLVQDWKGHNSLTEEVGNAIVSCIAGTNGGSTSPLVFGGCSSFVNYLTIIWTFGVPAINGIYSGPLGSCNTLLDFFDYAADIQYNDGCSATVRVSNTLTPIGCSPTSLLPGASTIQRAAGICTGWTSVATFLPSTFTSSNCASPCSLGNAFTSQATPGSGNIGIFDQIFPGVIHPSIGDTVLITIQFTFACGSGSCFVIN